MSDETLNVEIWGFENVEIWRCENVEMCRFGNPVRDDIMVDMEI